VLKLALRSEHLQLLSENDAYALASGWVASRPTGQRTDAFTELVRCLRFHHMSPVFLMTVVLRSKRWADCPLLAQVCSSAMVYQSLATSLSKVPHDHDAAHPFTSAKPSRVRDKDVTYSFEGEIPLAGCLPLGLNERFYLRLGVAEGYEMFLNVKRLSGPKKAPSVALYVHLICPDSRAVEEEEIDTVGLSGAMAAVRIEAADEAFSYTHLFEFGTSYGAEDFFEKPWDEVVREGSEYFPEGRMPVKVDVHFIADKHVKPQVPVLD
jgi:hypothetical protein